MINFKNTREVTEWLASKPTRARFPVVMRCALRLFPLAANVSRDSGVNVDLAMARLALESSINPKSAGLSSARKYLDKTRQRLYDNLKPLEREESVKYYHLLTTGSECLNAVALAASGSERAFVSAYQCVVDATRPYVDQYAKGREYFLDLMSHDAQSLETNEGTALETLPLFRKDTGNEAEAFFMKVGWGMRSLANPNCYQFWIDWYEGLLEGHEPDWELWHDVTLIEDEHWEAGPEAVAREIERVKAERFVRRARYTEPSPEVELTAVNSLQLDTAASIAAVRQGLETNRQTMPGSYAALQGLIESEIQRLQEDNFLNAEAPDQTKASLRALVAMWDAIEGMKGQVPTDQPTTEQQAEKTAGLLQEYLEAFKKLPQIKKEDVVEGTYQTFGRALRGCLAYGSANLCLLLNAGFPPVIAAAIGASVFIPDVPKSFWEAVRKK